MLSDFNIPAPRDWQKLERLCHELYAADWNDPNAQLNGRSGQEQAGVDIYGRPNKGPDYAGVQCKQRDGVPDAKPLSAKALRKEVDRAKTFKPPLKHFTIVKSACSAFVANAGETERSQTLQRARNLTFSRDFLCPRTELNRRHEDFQSPHPDAAK
jgi:hypothetical protein